MRNTTLIILFILIYILNTTTSDDSTTTTNDPGNAQTTQITDEDVTTKKIKRLKPPKASKPKAGRRQPTIWDAVKGANFWINRWFADLQDNKKWKTTTFVYKVFKQGYYEPDSWKPRQYFNQQRSYVTVCPHHNRARFLVNATREFSVYLVQNTANIKSDTYINSWEQGKDGWTSDNPASDDHWLANEEGGLKNNTIRITISYNYDSGIMNATIMLWTRTFSDISGGVWNYILRNDEPQRAEHFLRYVQLTPGTVSSYWLWWENTGLILMGVQGQPPFLGYYVNHIAGTDYNEQEWKIRALGFSNTAHKDSNKDENIAYVVKLDFPHDAKTGCTDTFDGMNDQDLEMDGMTKVQNKD